MSEPDVVVMDESPPPDVVERPARSQGAYKLCMDCGQNVLRFEYRAGSSICKRCEGRAEATTVLVGDLDDEESAALEVEEPSVQVAGSAAAGAWLASACGLREAGALTLDVLAAKLGSVLEQQTQMIGRVTRQRSLASELRPEDVPLEIAAQALWLACDATLQEALTAAMELLGLSLNQVILGNLAFSRQELLNQDQSLVPQASWAVQYGTGRGLLTQGQGRTGLPGGRLVDASGQLVKVCLCCGREFHPPRDRPNPDYCDEACGTYMDEVGRWVKKVVNNELRNPDAESGPMPQPGAVWAALAPERCQEPYLSHARAYIETAVPVQRAAAREQYLKMRGL